MKKILITGGLGFVGSHAIERYSKEGFDITIIDNLSSNTIPVDHEICENCTVIVDDILQYKWRNEDKFDYILHLASPVGPSGILKYSGIMGQYILDDIYWAIDGAKRNNCPLIFVSTSEIYGYRSSPVMLREDDDKILVGDFKVRNEYSIAKLLSEIVLSNTAKVSDLRYQIIRPFNISGRRQLKDGGFVLPTFVTQAIAGQDITVFGDGTQVRAFTHVEDIVDGIYKTTVASSENYNKIWNIGNPGNTISIQKMAEIVQSKLQSSSRIVHVDPKTIHGPLYEEAWDKIPDPHKIETELGWFPQWSVDQIIDDVIAHYTEKN